MNTKPINEITNNEVKKDEPTSLLKKDEKTSFINEKTENTKNFQFTRKMEESIKHKFANDATKWKELIPNILTISRIFIAFLIAILVIFLHPGNLHDYKSIQWYFDGNKIVQINNTYYFVGTNAAMIVAGILFLIGCITDFLDGYIARKYNYISDFGKLWDPIADKLLVNGTMIALAVNDSIPGWIVVLLVFRDIIVDGTRMLKAKQGILVPANIYGKIKTVLEMIGIIIIFFVMPAVFESKIPNVEWATSTVTNNGIWPQILVMFPATIASYLSGFIYMKQMLFGKKD